jgi:F-type H+-transporting ATPase subunit gamma
MAKTREIKGRMKAVGNIKRITKTMQLIANAQFQAASRRATSAKPYTVKIAELVGELATAAASAEGAGDQPLLKKPDPAVGRELVLVLTANRGLCGGYNANILRTAMQFLAAHKDKKIDIEVVGKKGVGFFKFNSTPLHRVHSHFGDKPKFADVEALATEYMALFSEGKYDAIRVIFMSFESMSRQKPAVLQLLPLQKPETDAGKNGLAVEYDFSPEPAKLLAELLPVTVKTRLFQSFNEAVVSEHIARMIAMKAATDAAGKMGKALSRKFNRARQTAITTELTEIIGGTAALE